MNKRDKIVEQIDNWEIVRGLILTNYDKRELADAIMEMDEAEARERHERAINSIFHPDDEVPSILHYRGSDVIDALKIASGLMK